MTVGELKSILGKHEDNSEIILECYECGESLTDLDCESSDFEDGTSVFRIIGRINEEDIENEQ